EDLASKQLVGYILFFNTLDEKGGDDPVAVIEDLFVKAPYRCRGIATQMWRKVLK
ncbi:Diamine acetyltransferase 2like, partial [Caligus rogercresseyi]